MGTKTIILLLLLMPSVFAECEHDAFTQRIFSQCKEDNNYCDDGENYLLDEDCEIDFLTIFEQMWFIRLILLLTVITLFMDKPAGPGLLIFFFALLVYNDAFYFDFGPEQPKEVYPCEISNIGACLIPSNPYIGWAIIILIAVILYFFHRRTKKFKY